MSRLIPAVRQAVGAALTSPPLTYAINNGSPQTLPTANIKPRAPWVGSGARPDPMVNFAVSSRGTVSLALADRHLTLKVWVSATGGSAPTDPPGDDLVTEIYEAVRGRLISPDNSGRTLWSRASAGSTLGVVIRECRETMMLAVDFDKDSNRWYCSAEFNVFAVDAN